MVMKNARELMRDVAVISFFALFGGAALLVFPHNIDAAGSAADAMCHPVFVQCPCGMMPSTNPPCIPGANMHQCPCFDVTNGFKTSGKCVAEGICKAESSDGKPPEMPKPPQGGGGGQPPQDPCQQGGAGGAGSGPNSQTTSTSTTASSTPPGACPSGAGDFSQPNFGFGTDFNSGAFNFSNPDTSGVDDLISSLLSGTIQSTTGESQNGSIVPQEGTSTPVKPFGSTEGVSGDVRVAGRYATILASSRDSTRGTQVSGFYGFSIASGVTAAAVFKNMCALRPWSSNFISFIIPSSFFDSLCKLRGFEVGTSAPAVTTTSQPKAPTTQTQPPATPPKPKYLGPVRADIWASPPSVQSGTRTSVFWDSAGVVSCTISSSDGKFGGTALSGHASTQSLTQATTFSIRCESATSTVSNEVVVTVAP